MRRLLWVTLPPLLVFSIGCGSLWREVQARSFSELSMDLQQFIELNDPHREEVQTLIDEGWMAAWEGRLGAFGGVGFEVAFENAAADGEFDDTEVRALRDHASPFLRRSPEGARRDQLLALKSAMDAEVMVERRAVVRRRRRGRSGASSDLSDWVLPDDVRDAAQTSGWEPQGACRYDEIDGIEFVFCEAEKAKLVATIKMDRYPDPSDAEKATEVPNVVSAVRQVRDTVLRVTVVDGIAGEALRNAIVAKGDRLDNLSAAPMQAAIRGAGWQLDGCDAHKEGGTVTVSCEANQHRKNAIVDLVVHAGGGSDPANEERVVSGGEASVLQGRNYLTATVTDLGPANELADAMLD